MILIETLNQLKFARKSTSGLLKQSIDKEWDTQPKGFSNTIRWNAGHIFVSMEGLIQRALPSYEAVHPEWNRLFRGGTSPASWEGDIPSNEELRTALKEQIERHVEFLEGKLGTSIAKPRRIGSLPMDTVEGVVQFCIWHEALHAGIIDGLNRTTAE